MKKISWMLLFVIGVAQADNDAPQHIVEQARAAAKADHNAESMTLFQRAIELAPERRHEWLHEWADQTTYAGRAADAIPLYQEVLALPSRSPDERWHARKGLALALSWAGRKQEALMAYQQMRDERPADRDARLGYARILSWLDRNAEAQDSYEAFLRDSPDDTEARRDLARVKSWRGHHRAAQQDLGAMLQQHPDDQQTIEVLARSQQWMGRSDRAHDTVSATLAAPGNHAGALHNISRELATQNAPITRFDYQQSSQSDDLAIRTTTFEHILRWNYGVTEVGPHLQWVDYDPQQLGAAGSIRVSRPGIKARHRVNDSLEWNGNTHLDSLNVGAGNKDHTILTYDTYLTYFPGDRWRFDVGTNRTTFDNVRSQTRGITAHSVNLSGDYTPDELTRLTLRAGQTAISDGNNQQMAQFELEQRVIHHPRTRLGWRSTTFQFDQQLNNGYFNPLDYQSHVVTLRSSGSPAPGLDAHVEVGGGKEFVKPDGDKWIWSAGTRLSYHLPHDYVIEARYSYFTSATASSGGFSRGTTGVTLRKVW